MIYHLRGKLIIKKPNFAVIDTNGIGFKVFISTRTFRQLPKIGSTAKLFCHTHFLQTGMELYGFLNEQDIEIFEMLNSINGIGPKGALKILSLIRVESLLSAIHRGKSDILIKTAGIGDKKANRIILELKDKIKHSKIRIDEDSSLETEIDIEEILRALGYKKNEAIEAIRKISPKAKTIEEKIKSALKNLGRI